jgi:hypothetical protein
VFPDLEMPYVEYKGKRFYAEFVMGTTTVIKRGTPGQVFEAIQGLKAFESGRTAHV